MSTDDVEKVIVSVEVRGADRIKAMDELKARDHSSRSSVLNKGLDLLIKTEFQQIQGATT
jgi:hypothetical protein